MTDKQLNSTIYIYMYYFFTFLLEGRICTYGIWSMELLYIGWTYVLCAYYTNNNSTVLNKYYYIDFYFFVLYK